MTLLDTLLKELGAVGKQVEITESQLTLLKARKQNLLNAVTQEKINNCIEKYGKHDMYNPNFKWTPITRRDCRNCPYSTGR
jgi:hypothetical protein